jgi:Tfp pilus assembly protein PilN
VRPVNLIPPEDRRGEHAPMRTGPVPYVVVGVLLAALAGVAALVLTSNQIADRKSEVAKLERQDAAVSARAQRFAAYSQFRTLREQRVATVTSLADSRFDWERVMRELSLVLPNDVWLVSLTATASPSVSLNGGGGSSSGSSGGSGLRGSAAGPALEISGCASSQDAVAGFVTTLKDIDGVTRVGVQSSALPDQSGGAGVSTGGGASSGGSSGSDCQTRDFIARFEIVVAFDAAPVPVTSSTAPVAPAAPAPDSSTTTSTTTPAGG